MILHALTLGALLILIIAFCSTKKKHKEMYNTFQLMKTLTYDTSGYLIPNHPIMKLNAPKGSTSSDDSGVSFDDGYSDIGQGKRRTMSQDLPPDLPPDHPPSPLHKVNTYLDPAKRKTVDRGNLQSSAYLDLIQDEDTAAYQDATSGYEHLPRAKGDAEKSHNYQELKQMFEKGNTNSSFKYESLGERPPSAKHDYNKLNTKNNTIELSPKESITNRNSDTEDVTRVIKDEKL